VFDWPGSGRSEKPSTAFGYDEMVEGALAVIRASETQRVVPVAQAHAGWAAIELRRRLGERIPKLVLTSFLVLDSPPLFLVAIEAAQDPARWQEACDRVFATWLEGVTHSDVVRFVREVMGSYSLEMWARAGREITAAYARYGTPLKALASAGAPSLRPAARPELPGRAGGIRGAAPLVPGASTRGAQPLTDDRGA
jgi:pimeloyl-ACP methyl ester carboxylesterase